jgi:hypothetical protein
MLAGAEVPARADQEIARALACEREESRNRFLVPVRGDDRYSDGILTVKLAFETAWSKRERAWAITE